MIGQGRTKEKQIQHQYIDIKWIFIVWLDCIGQLIMHFVMRRSQVRLLLPAPVKSINYSYFANITNKSGC